MRETATTGSFFGEDVVVQHLTSECCVRRLAGQRRTKETATRKRTAPGESCARMTDLATVRKDACSGPGDLRAQEPTRASLLLRLRARVEAGGTSARGTGSLDAIGAGDRRASEVAWKESESADACTASGRRRERRPWGPRRKRGRDLVGRGRAGVAASGRRNCRRRRRAGRGATNGRRALSKSA